MSQQKLTYAERRPIRELHNWIQSLWTFDASRLDASVHEHFVPPDGCISILKLRQAPCPRSSIILVGPRWQPHQVPIHGGDCYDGVRFWPFSAHALFGDELPHLVGYIGPLAMVSPQLTETIAAAFDRPAADTQPLFAVAVQDVLLRRLPELEMIDPLVRETIVRMIAARGAEPVSSIAAELTISLRQLQRRFNRATGLTLKQFARIRRFREAASELLRQVPRPWCQVALDAGYADQAHLTREFSQMIGLSATELEIRHAAIRHENVQP
jgi:AraC-like DNA-binding protein